MWSACGGNTGPEQVVVVERARAACVTEAVSGVCPSLDHLNKILKKSTGK